MRLNAIETALMNNSVRAAIQRRFEAAERLLAMGGRMRDGALVLLGLAARAAVLPLIAIMLTAITTMKLPILLGGALGPFHVQDLADSGFWAMAHEARTDWSMLLGSLFMLVVGSGRWSLDDRLARRHRIGIAR